MTANGRHRAGDGAALGLAELDERIDAVQAELIDLLFEKAKLNAGYDKLVDALAPEQPKPFFTPEIADDEVPPGWWRVVGTRQMGPLTEFAYQQDAPSAVSSLSQKLAPYRVPQTVAMPGDVMCAVLEAVARCDLSQVKPLLGDLRTSLTLRDQLQATPGRMAELDAAVEQGNIDYIEGRLCDLIAAEDVWPRQAAHNRRDHIYHGGQ